MPAEIVHTRLVTAAAHEVLTIMDDYGTEHILHIPIKDGANRQARIDKTVALMSANQAALEKYAADHGHDLSAQKTAGLAKKQALKGGKQ